MLYNPMLDGQWTRNALPKKRPILVQGAKRILCPIHQANKKNSVRKVPNKMWR